MHPSKGGKRSPTEELEGPRKKDPDGEPRGVGGAPPMEAGVAEDGGRPPLREARGAEPDDAAAAAGRRDDVRPEDEDFARQPGQGGDATDGRTTLTPRLTEAGALKAGTAAGPGTVADIEEGRP